MAKVIDKKVDKKTDNKKVEVKAKTEKVVETKVETVEDIKPEIIEIIEVKKEEIVEKVETKKIPLKKPNNDEMILCKSVVLGDLVYVSQKTGTHIIWNDFGAEEYLEFGELITMKSAQSRFLNEPWIVIDDERVIEYLGLKNLYAQLVDLENLEGFFGLSLEQISVKLKQVTSGVRKLIAEKARQMIENQTLYDTRIISLLEKELDIELKIVED